MRYLSNELRMTELSTAIIVFLVSAAAVQVLALRLYAKEVFWASTDYVWLCVAALALVSLTAEARRDEARASIPAQEEHLRGMAAIAEQEVHFSLNFLTMFIEVEVKNEPPEIALQKREFRKLKTSLLPYLEATGHPGWASRIDKFHSEEALLSGISDPVARSVALRIGETMNRVRSSHDELLRLKGKLEVSFLERFRVYLAPFLVAITLALRLGKTTAEIKRKRSTAGKGDRKDVRSQSRVLIRRRINFGRRKLAASIQSRPSSVPTAEHMFKP